MNHTTQPDKPLPGIRFYIAITVVLAVTLAAFFSGDAHAAGMATYSFRQDNLDANSQPVIHSKTVGPVPMPLNATETTPNSSYGFDVTGLQPTSTSLSTRASFTVDVDQTGLTETWSRSRAHATAEASLVDFATVQGISGTPSGTVVFNWVVTGVAALSLDTTPFSIVQVNDLTTTAKLESTIPNSMGSLLDDTHTYPNNISSAEMWQQNHAIASDVIVFNVPWQAGTQMPVFFDLTSTADLDISNLDATGFQSALDVDLSNTAVLQGVEIVDDNGIELPNARLVSEDGFVYPNVPEPSALCLFVVGLLFVRAASRCR